MTSILRTTCLAAAALVLGLLCGLQSPPLNPDDAPAAAPPLPADPPATGASLAAIDQVYKTLLETIVNRDGLVRYDKLAMARHTDWLNQIVDGYAKISLPADSRDRLAFWCNAYNVNVLKMALEECTKEGFETVQNVPGFFDSRPIIVAGEALTLSGLANDQIRREGDPRVHAVLVSGAKSSPPLRAEPYVAERLDKQFEDQCRRWINDRSRNYVRGDVLVLSRLLDWYGSDFIGKPYGDRLGFVKAYAEPEGPIAAYIRRTEKPKIEWELFNWSLNQAPLRPSPRQEPGK